MTKDDEAQIRCAKSVLDIYDLNRCSTICHDNCLGILISSTNLSTVYYDLIKLN